MVKRGFSLAEALVVMAIISVLFAAVAKVITTRPEKPKQTNMHGYFECYVDGGTLKQRYVRNGASTPVESVGSECHFEPISGVAFYNINSYVQGTTITWDTSVTPPTMVDDNGVYYSHFEPNISTELYITKTSNTFRLRSSNGRTLDLSDNATRPEQELFFRTLYDGSEMYNGGTMRNGVMISW